MLRISTHRIHGRVCAIALLAMLALAAGITTSPADAGDRATARGSDDTSAPGIVSPSQYGKLGARWWKWAFSFPFENLPYFNTGGPVDISAHQSGNVWFLAGANSGLTQPRTGSVPAGKKLFFPMANFINDYPCPDPSFQPGPGESLEAFLQRTGNEAMDEFGPSTVFAELNGVPFTNLLAYRSTSKLFRFTADPDIVAVDPCITGERQAGVSVGYYLGIEPLPPGVHTLHFGAPDWNQDITYIITVTRRGDHDHDDDDADDDD